ncbi:MAG: SLC13 family permease [Bacteroidales bacterium]|nr:SLC13 family permease [Bacteroidales bacterium]
MDKKFLAKLLIVLLPTLLLWFMPGDCFGMDNLTVIEQRVIAIFYLAASMWITELFPIWTTSVFVIVLMLLTVSDSSLMFLRPEGLTDLLQAKKNGVIDEAGLSQLAQIQASYGTAISYKSIMATWADPIIMLFLGGFCLAIAATRCNLDINLARVLLKPFGTRSEIVLFGFMIITAVFSMFMSNTATAAMMLTIIAPVLKMLPAEGKGRIALALAIPVAANVGGIGTPIGTPPNAIALKYMSDSGICDPIGFGQWMLVMVPFVIIILVFAWFLLLTFFPFKAKHVNIKLDGEFRKDKQSMIVYITFGVTVLLWLLDSVSGLNSNVVAMIPIAVFCLSGIIGKEELKSINWDVLWLVAGGFALGVGLQGSGLAKHLVETIPFSEWPALVVLIVSGLVCYLMSTFMSHTASSALLVPILAAVAKGMGGNLDSIGGISTMLIGVAIASSLAMAMPISTPPNALAIATGYVKPGHLAKIGVIIGIVGIALGYVVLIFSRQLGLL